MNFFVIGDKYSTNKVENLLSLEYNRISPGVQTTATELAKITQGGQ